MLAVFCVVFVPLRLLASMVDSRNMCDTRPNLRWKSEYRQYAPAFYQLPLFYFVEKESDMCLQCLSFQLHQSDSSHFLS
jgi:hypothetical protein